MIAVTGATGFVGLHVVEALGKKALPFRCLVRSGSRRKSRLHDFHPEIYDVHFEEMNSIAHAIRGCDVVIHCLGLINGSEKDLQKANVECTRKVVEAAKKEGVKKFIHVSSVAAMQRHGPYGKTKFESEKIVVDSGVPYLIFRPAYIYGWGDEQHTGLMLRVLKNLFVIPLLGGGSFKLQPVYIDDVVSVLLEAMDSPVVNRAFPIAGSEQIPLREMLELFAEGLGLKRAFLPIPLKPVQAVLRFYAHLFRNTRLPVKPVLELDKHEAFDISETSRCFDFQPIPFREGVTRMFRKELCAA